MIAKKLRYYRAIYRLSQRDLAALAGVNETTIAQIEVRDSNVTLDTALKLAKAFDISIDSLIGDLTENQREKMQLCNQRIRELQELKEENSRHRRIERVRRNREKSVGKAK